MRSLVCVCACSLACLRCVSVCALVYLGVSEFACLRSCVGL